MARLLRPLRDLARARRASLVVTGRRAREPRASTTGSQKIQRVVELDTAPSRRRRAPTTSSSAPTPARSSTRRATRPRSASRDDPDTEGQRSDTIMVAHVEPGSQQTFVVRFPRDLMVNVPGTPGKSQINAAYAIGGPQLVIDTLKENFGIDINHYLEVDFKSFQEIVDTIGYVQRVPARARRATRRPGSTRRTAAGATRSTVRPRSPTCASRNLQISDPNGADRRSRHRRALAPARRPRRPRPHRPPAGVHPQARRPRDLEEPQRPVPRGRSGRQRARSTSRPTRSSAATT